LGVREALVLHVVYDAFIIISCYIVDRMQQGDDQTKTNRATVRRVTVAEAARLLNLSAEAVRSRVQRGTLDSIKVDGTVYVLLDADQTQQNAVKADNQTPLIHGLLALVESLQDQVTYLREQLDQERKANRENRRIITALAQRIPQLPELLKTPKPETQELAESPESRPWWRMKSGG
jgi:CII-binding regulator of phage lambda lysogenization HflD